MVLWVRNQTKHSGLAMSTGPRMFTMASAVIYAPRQLGAGFNSNTGSSVWRLGSCCGLDFLVHPQMVSPNSLFSGCVLKRQSWEDLLIVLYAGVRRGNCGVFRWACGRMPLTEKQKTEGGADLGRLSEFWFGILSLNFCWTHKRMSRSSWLCWTCRFGEVWCGYTVYKLSV